MKAVEEQAEEYAKKLVGEALYKTTPEEARELELDFKEIYLEGATSERERANIEIEFWKNIALETYDRLPNKTIGASAHQRWSEAELQKLLEESK